SPRSSESGASGGTSDRIFATAASLKVTPEARVTGRVLLSSFGFAGGFVRGSVCGSVRWTGRVDRSPVAGRESPSSPSPRGRLASSATACAPRCSGGAIVVLPVPFLPIADRRLDRVFGEHRAVDLDRRQRELLDDHRVLDLLD